MTQTPLANQTSEDPTTVEDPQEANNNYVNNAIAAIQAESESINGSIIVPLETGDEDEAESADSLPKLVLNVSESEVNGRTGSLSFNDVDGEGWADLQPESYQPSSLGAFSITAPDNNGFSSWSYQPGRSLDSGEYAIDSYLIEDSQGAEYQIDISVSGEDDLSSIDGVLTGQLIEGISNSQRGIVTINDPDVTDAPDKPAGTKLLAYDGVQGDYGTFSFAGGNTNDVEWVYTPDSESDLFDSLGTGQTVVENFEVKTTDGQVETITITLHGADDPNVFTGAEAITDALAIQTDNDLLKAGGSFDLSAEAMAEAVDQAFNLTEDNVADAVAQANAIAIEHEGSLDALLNADAPGLLQLTSTNGGSVDIDAFASADAEGSLGSEADADAVAIGFQNVSVTTDGEGDIALNIDATAEAQSNAEIISTIEADATAYGLQGTDNATEAITVSGNPYANVSAEANVIGDNNAEMVLGNITAESVGIENANITSNGTNNTIGAEADASISATDLGSNVSGADDLREVTASAIAIEDTNVRSNDQQGSTIRGNADLSVDLEGWEGMESQEIDSLASIGMRNASITTSSGDDHVEGTAKSAINQFEMLNEEGSLDVEGGGMINSTVITGTGNDVVIGNASGDGLSKTSGFVDSNVDTGVGNDQITGGASNSSFETGIGDDAITLEASEDSILDGGIGADQLSVTGTSSNTELHGGVGNDQLQGGSGDDLIHGGVGDDVLEGGSGADQFVYKSVDLLRGSDQINDFNAAEGDSIVISNNLLGLDEGTVLEFVTANEITNDGSADMDQSMIVDTMGNILSMGTVTNARLAYATDTGDLLFDSNGDWSQGSRTIANLSQDGNVADITTESIQVSEQTVSTEQVASSQSFSEATQLGSQTAISTQQDSSSNDGASAAIPDSAVNSEETLASGSVAIE